MPRKRYLLALSVILAAFGAGAWTLSKPPPPPLPVVILGDSIARGTCCATVQPAFYFDSARSLGVNGNHIARVTDLLPKVEASRIFVHVGINDVRDDNRHAERDLAELLAAIRARSQTVFVIDELGPIDPPRFTPEREALRQRMNAQLRAFNAPNARVVPFVATHFMPDGLHPDDAGYAQQMPLVVAAMDAMSRDPRTPQK